MNLASLMSLLRFNEKSQIRLKLPGRRYVESHFHVTEIGRLSKDFIDCGGTRRKRESCLIQLFVADDYDHRVDASKLLHIFSLSGDLKLDDCLAVDVEYGSSHAVIFNAISCSTNDGFLDIELAYQKTDCLAPDKCGINSVKSCCEGRGCC